MSAFDTYSTSIFDAAALERPFVYPEKPMAMKRVFFEIEVEADSREDAAIIVRDMLKTGSSASVFIVDVAGGKVAVDTEYGNETVIRDDRKRIGPVFERRDGPTGVVTSPVMAEFYDHDCVSSRTDLEQVDGKWLRLWGYGPEAFYELVGTDGSKSEPFAVITVNRHFGSHNAHPATHLALAAYAKNAQH